MSAIDDYLAANAEFERCKKALDDLTRNLQTFANQLSKNPENTMFSNGSVGLPVDIVMSQRTVSFDAHTWPTPDNIQTVISERFEAKRRVQAAWSVIPQDLRASVVPPKF